VSVVAKPIANMSSTHESFVLSVCQLNAVD